MWVYFQNQIKRLTFLARVRALRLFAVSELVELEQSLGAASTASTEYGLSSPRDSSKCQVQEAAKNAVSDMGTHPTTPTEFYDQERKEEATRATRDDPFGQSSQSDIHDDASSLRSIDT